MANPPVNSLNKELLNALNMSLMDVQKEKYRGIILTSSLPNVFSAGLDIKEMYNRTEKQLIEYWQTLQDAWLTLYNLKIPVAAAINVLFYIISKMIKNNDNDIYNHVFTNI